MTVLRQVTRVRVRLCVMGLDLSLDQLGPVGGVGCSLHDVARSYSAALKRQLAGANCLRPARLVRRH